MKKSIEWRTPKVYQRGWDRLLRSIPSKKPKGYCIKLKDKHDFILMKQEASRWFDEICREYKCRGCDKKKFEFIKSK